MRSRQLRSWSFRAPRGRRWLAVLGLALGALFAWQGGGSPAPAQAQGLGGFVSPGPLASAHSDVEGITHCAECHQPGAGVDPDRCLACHDSVAEQVKTRRGFHADRDEQCESCHPDHRGADFEMVELSPEHFNHQSTGFALRGAHAPLACDECHTEADAWSGLESSCVSCHDDPHGAAASSRPLLASCRACHDEEDWKAQPLAIDVFDHSDPAAADYALHGKHADVECVECHVDWTFVPVASEACVDCHEDPHGGQFGRAVCEDCHDVDHAKFKIPRFDHAGTRYPLAGAHRGVGCAACHGRGPKARYRPLTFDRCDACHDDPHEGQFAPRDCDACHSLGGTGFELSDFDHDGTDFPIRGAHLEVTCDLCHGEGPAAEFAGVPFDDCSSCHDDVHEDRFAPDACSSCHADANWLVDEFDHDRTDYPLTGAHAPVECDECHGEVKVEPVAFDSCADCHAEQDPHEGKTDRDACGACHVTADWATVTFDHAQQTEFALEGAHSAAACSACHAPGPRSEAASLPFEGLEQACDSCHEEERPKAHFAGDCGECHSAESWTVATLGALGHDVTGFVLRGEHRDLPCEDCHATTDSNTAAAPGCISCHAADDAHRNLLGDSCEDCHRESDWLRTRFRHDLVGWPLRGEHRLAACVDCHATGYAGAPTECVRCHEREALRDEVHQQSFSRECDLCHRPYDWDDVRYTHGDR